MLTRTLLATAMTMALSTTAYAVTPGQFSHTTEADFATGDAYGTVVTNLGDIRLSSDTTELTGLPEDVTVIHDIVKLTNGQTYIAAGPEARLYRLVEDGVELVAEYEGEQVFTLTAVGDKLMIGVSAGEASRLEVLGDDGPQLITALPDTDYIWDMLAVPQSPGQVLLATGSDGKVLQINTDEPGEPRVLLEVSQANVLSLAIDNSGNIYAGTDTDGLIYRIDADGNPFVVYDAGEAEIAALLTMPDGTVYAGTAAIDQARPGRLEQPVENESGRPDVPELRDIDVEPAPDELQVDPPKPDAAPDADGDGDDVAPLVDEEAGRPVEVEGEDAEEGGEEEAAAAPTAEQYDALRANLRERLRTARETGQLDAQADGSNNNNNAAPNRPSRATPAAPPTTRGGNAIYRISPDGFVTEVFRETSMILAIVPQGDRLIVATGNQGQVYSINPSLRETTVLADLDSAQVTCAAATDAGLLLGAANPGALMLMETATAEEGGYTSRVLDAGQVSLFGTFRLTADIPQGTTVSIEMRSGNVGDPELAAWSQWTAPQVLAHNPDANPLQPIEVRLDVPPARYLQYRLSLTGDGHASPVIDQADLAYVAPNSAPTVARLAVAAAEVGAPGTDHDAKVTIQWQATDENSDRLLFSLEYRPGQAEHYLPLADELTGNKYEWQTQHVPDGWYTVRLTAHDYLDNPADSARTGGRVSEPVLIDNTPPALNGLQAQILGNGRVRLTATAADELSAVRSVAYSIDGSDTYQASLPQDLIYDSTSEDWGVTISDLSPGGHVLAVRVIDAKGNTAYRQLIVDVQ